MQRRAPTGASPTLSSVNFLDISNVDVWSIPGADLQLPCRDLLIPSGEAHTVARELERRGSTFVGTETYDGLRIEAGLPMWGIDALPGAFPNESGFTGSIDFSKGCFLGQEIITRIFQLGPRTQIMGMRFNTAPPPAGSSLVVSDGPVIEATSTGWCPRSNAPGGLANVPVDFASSGAEVFLLGSPEEPIGVLVDVPFTATQG